VRHIVQHIVAAQPSLPTGMVTGSEVNVHAVSTTLLPVGASGVISLA
jgi:hypothetical protein